MRKKLLFGNWKMNKTREEAKAFAEEAKELDRFARAHDIEIGVAPTYLSLCPVHKVNPDLIIAAQNCHFEEKGAFTGEISIPMLLDIGVKWCIIGHSERRTYFGETNEACNKKLHALFKNDMTPIYCVGETLEQFEAGKTKDVIKEQTLVGINGLAKEDIAKLVIAYEPVWSIGTGKNASTEIAEDICGYIRELVRGVYGDVADEMRILYGGSVKPENVKAYLGEKDVDGALVGGASLKVESFRQLIENIL